MQTPLEGGIRQLARFAVLLSFVLIASARTGGALLDPVPYGKSFTGDNPKPSETRHWPQRPDDFSNAPLVRFGYIIPTNRVPQAHAIPTLQTNILVWRLWFLDQMAQAGFASKAFRYETEADGITPLIHLVYVPETDDYIRVDVWGRAMTAAANAGLTLWAEGEAWLIIPETHLENPDGSLTGGVFLGASYGSGSDPGLAMVGSDALARMKTEYLTNDTEYDGMIIPEIGSYPLKQDISFPWFEGRTLSSLSSSARGGALHELGHALGLGHDFKNDENFRGSLMGNGLRGFRGVLYPGRYPQDYTRLSLAHAMAANTSRYFNSNRTDFAKPSVSILTESPVSATNGLVEIHFNGFEIGSFAWAWLLVNGDLVDERVLAEQSVDAAFATYLWTPDSNYEYEVVLSDLEGNRSSVKRELHVIGYDTRAPWPSVVRVSPQVAFVNEPVVLDGSGIYDLVGDPALFRLEWDFDNDGSYDTSPGPDRFCTARFPVDGPRLIRVRATGSDGAQALSTPVPLSPHQPALCIELRPDRGGALLSWRSRLGYVYQLERSADLVSWTAAQSLPQAGDGSIRRLTLPVAANGNLFNGFRLSATKRFN